MNEEFVGEPLEPIQGSFDTAAMATGQPGLPRGFMWRGDEYIVDTVLQQWKESGPEKGGGRERYLRKHWYHLRMTNGCEMKVYFERQARSKRRTKARWWLYTLSTPGKAP